MNVRKSIKNVVLTCAFAFVMALACVGVAKAETVAPGQVMGLKQSAAKETSVKVEWTALLNNGVKYEVDISTDNVNWIPKDTTSANSSGISGLTAGTSYYVRVRAYVVDESTEEKLYGAYSASMDVVTAPNVKPVNVKKLDATTNSITIQWDNVEGANTYYIKYTNSAQEQLYVPASTTTSTSVVLTGIAANSRSYIDIYPAKTNSTNTYTAIGGNELSTSYMVVPGKVTGVAVDGYWVSLGQMDVKCTRISGYSSYEAELWTCYKKKDKKLTSAYNGYTTRVDIGLSHSELKKHRFFKVRMRGYTTNSAEEKIYGEWSDWMYVCQQPHIISTKSVKKGIQVRYDTIKGADRYVVYMSTKKDSGYKKIGTTKKTKYTIKKFGKKKLKKGKTYYIYVVAQNKVGKKYYSELDNYVNKITWKY